MLGRWQQPQHISYNLDQTLAPGQITTSTTGPTSGATLLRANSFRFTFTPTNHILSNHHYYSNNANSRQMISQRTNNNQSTAGKTVAPVALNVEEASIVELE